MSLLIILNLIKIPQLIVVCLKNYLYLCAVKLKHIDMVEIPKNDLVERPWWKSSSVIASIVKKRMAELGLSQIGLAVKMGCSQQYISKILKGRENLPLETLSKLGDALGVEFFNENVCYTKSADEILVSRGALSAYYTPDRKVFVNNSTGWMFERTGVVVERGFDCDGKAIAKTSYIDEFGTVQTNGENCEDNFVYVGVVGDSITPAKLRPFYPKYLDNEFSLDEMFVDAEKYFKFDWGKAPDVLELKFYISEDFEVTLDKGDFFLFKDRYFDLRSLDSEQNDFDGEFVGELLTYQELIGKPLKLSIDFDVFLPKDMTIEEVRKWCGMLKEYREKYLEKLRNFLVSELVAGRERMIPLAKRENPQEYADLCRQIEGDGKIFEISNKLFN